MRFLLEPPDPRTLDAAVGAAWAARDSGLDGVLLAPTAALPSPLVVACAVATAVPDVLLAAEVPLGDRHPVEVAEEAAVTDLAAGGRLVLVVRPAVEDAERFAEALELLRTAATPRPFAFRGRHWTVPARLPQNTRAVGDTTRITPAPLQPRIEVWTSGAGGDAGVRSGLGHLAASDDDAGRLGAWWAAAQERVGPPLVGAPHARREDWTGAEALVARLRAGRSAFAQDWAVVRAPAIVAADIGSLVRPLVQLDRLPAGLEDHWASG